MRLPGYLGAPPVAAARPVTVRHVLTHTSGLTMRPANRGLTPAQRDKVTNGGKGHATLREHVRAAAVIPGYFHPGDRWLYGDSTNYVAALVEEISGQSLDAFLRERIFEPLGMEDTFYFVPREKVDRVAAIYRPAADGAIELARAPKFVEPTRYFPGIAGLKSTAIDYIRFAQMIANGGELDGVRLLGRMTVNNMITNQTGALPIDVRGPGYGFGLGYGILTNPAQDGRCAIGRQLHVGRRVRHAVLGRSGGRPGRHPADPAPAVQPLQHPADVLERGDAGGGRQPGRPAAQDHGPRDPALAGSPLSRRRRW